MIRGAGMGAKRAFVPAFCNFDFTKLQNRLVKCYFLVVKFAGIK